VGCRGESANHGQGALASSATVLGLSPFGIVELNFPLIQDYQILWAFLKTMGKLTHIECMHTLTHT
jgi:hypothetical protein